MPILYRWADRSDYNRLGQIMYEAVHATGSPYTVEQRQAWVPKPRCGTDWVNRLNKQAIILAQNDEVLIGFMSLQRDEGYIDFAYILGLARGQGIFRTLYSYIEKMAFEQGLTRLWLHASLMAEPAFQAMGFCTVKREDVEIGHQRLLRCLMEKPLF